MTRASFYPAFLSIFDREAPCAAYLLSWSLVHSDQEIQMIHEVLRVYSMEPKLLA